MTYNYEMQAAEEYTHPFPPPYICSDPFGLLLDTEHHTQVASRPDSISTTIFYHCCDGNLSY
jgi:hypothetical protein